MNKQYLVLANADFNRSIHLHQSTSLTDFAEADCDATEMVKEPGCEYCYVFELKYKYMRRPEKESRLVEEVYVDV